MKQTQGHHHCIAMLIVLSILCVLSTAQPAASMDAQAALPAMHAWYRLLDHSAQVTLDYSGTDLKLYSGAKLEAVCRTKSGQELGRASALHMPTQLLGIPLKEKLPDGDYTVDAVLTDASGKQNRLSLAFSRKRSEWEDNGIGVTDKVIAPWVPMTVDGNTASCWGRVYTFGTLGLPSQIRSTQPEPTRGTSTKNLLASPVEMVVETARGKLKWSSQAPLLRKRTDAYVDVTASARTEGGELSTEIAGTLEFDGFYKFKLKIVPSRPVQVNSIRIEIPLPDKIGVLFHTVGETMRSNNAFLDFQGKPDGELWNSYNSFALQKYMSYNQKTLVAKAGPGGGFPRGYAGKYYSPLEFVGTFYPQLWLGDDDRGVAFMGDSDRGWMLDYSKPCQDIVRKNGKTILRLLLVNSPTLLDKPIETTLSLQATPVRPRPKGGSYKKVPTYGWSQFDKPHVWNGCLEPYKQGKGEIYYSSDDARKNDLWWRYFCFYSDRMWFGKDSPFKVETSDYEPDWAVHKEEWLTGSDFGWLGPCSAHIASNADWRMWWYKQWHDIGGMDGIYYDNTFPHITNKLGPGIAWEDESGRIHPSFVCFDNREYIKRVRAYFTEQGPSPVISAHMSDAAMIGYLGFADVWWDGENGGRPDCTAEQEQKWGKALDFVDRWGNPGGLANLRITLGRQWGTIPKYLYVWGFDATHTILGMFDLDNCYTRMNYLGFDFGQEEEDVVFIPYWDARKPAKFMGSEDDVLSTLWIRPGRVRILLSNLSRHERTVDVKLDTKTFSIPKNAVAIDDQTGEAVEISNGTMRGIHINGHNYRAVLVAAPGVFAPNPSGDRLVQGTRIEGLCDDFDALDGWKMIGKNADLWNGTLRIPGQPCSLARRTFGEDNCSVQIKVQCGNGPVWTNLYWRAYPKIMLYWKQGTYLGVSAGYGHANPNGKFNQSFSCLDGKTVNTAFGPSAGAVNWLRITLKPDHVEFYSSTDGEVWDKIDTIPRAGYAGAPAYLFVGRGDIIGPNELTPCAEDGDGTSCFDDLVTWR